MSDQRQFTNAEKHECAQREVKMRRKVYPRWIAMGKMDQLEAMRQIAIMEAIASDYKPKDLFDAKQG